MYSETKIEVKPSQVLKDVLKKYNKKTEKRKHNERHRRHRGRRRRHRSHQHTSAAASGRVPKKKSASRKKRIHPEDDLTPGKIAKLLKQLQIEDAQTQEIERSDFSETGSDAQDDEEDNVAPEKSNSTSANGAAKPKHNDSVAFVELEARAPEDVVVAPNGKAVVFRKKKVHKAKKVLKKMARKVKKVLKKMAVKAKKVLKTLKKKFQTVRKLKALKKRPSQVLKFYRTFYWPTNDYYVVDLFSPNSNQTIQVSSYAPGLVPEISYSCCCL